jgi:AP-4 complex subunit epsilon-1
VYECIKTVTAIHPSPALLAGAVESVARFLGARENNLKYAGIDALARLVRIDPKHAQVGPGGGWRGGLQACRGV